MADVKVLIVEKNGTELSDPTEYRLLAPDVPFTDPGFVSTDVKGAILEAKGQSGTVAFGSFSGNPKVYDVVLTTAFPDAGYAVSVVGFDSRAWTVENQTSSGFRINAHANALLTGPVQWTAVYNS